MLVGRGIVGATPPRHLRASLSGCAFSSGLLSFRRRFASFGDISTNVKLAIASSAGGRVRSSGRS